MMSYYLTKGNVKPFEFFWLHCYSLKEQEDLLLDPFFSILDFNALLSSFNYGGDNHEMLGIRMLLSCFLFLFIHFTCSFFFLLVSNAFLSIKLQ